MTKSENHAYKVGFNGGYVSTTGMPSQQAAKIDSAVVAGQKASGRR